MQGKIADFVMDNVEEKITLQPMNKIQRSIMYLYTPWAIPNITWLLILSKYSHEISETAGLSAFSFGEEDVDRHVVVFKKEFMPCQEELSAYRRGLEWKPKSVKEVMDF